MKHKPIKIDWDDLEEAFSDRLAETPAFLDCITGHVVLEGEGEEDDLDDEQGTFGKAPPARREDPARILIRPPDTTDRIEWMKAFIEKGDVPSDVAADLAGALDEEDVPQALSDVLNRNPEVRDAWYLYRSERVYDRIDEWLAENGIEAADAPPWK
jgi:hypothetical protein